MEGNSTCDHSSHRHENDDTTDEFDLGDSAFLYWAWAASVVGPVVYILAVVHAVLWGLPSAIVGSLVCMCIYNIINNVCIKIFADGHSWNGVHHWHWMWTDYKWNCIGSLSWKSW